MGSKATRRCWLSGNSLGCCSGSAPRCRDWNRYEKTGGFQTIELLLRSMTKVFLTLPDSRK